MADHDVFLERMQGFHQQLKSVRNIREISELSRGRSNLDAPATGSTAASSGASTPSAPAPRTFSELLRSNTAAAGGSRPGSPTRSANKAPPVLALRPRASAGASVETSAHHGRFFVDMDPPHARDATAELPDAVAVREQPAFPATASAGSSYTSPASRGFLPRDRGASTLSSSQEPTATLQAERSASEITESRDGSPGREGMQSITPIRRRIQALEQKMAGSQADAPPRPMPQAPQLPIRGRGASREVAKASATTRSLPALEADRSPSVGVVESRMVRVAAAYAKPPTMGSRPQQRKSAESHVAASQERPSWIEERAVRQPKRGATPPPSASVVYIGSPMPQGQDSEAPSESPSPVRSDLPSAFSPKAPSVTFSDQAFSGWTETPTSKADSWLREEEDEDEAHFNKLHSSPSFEGGIVSRAERRQRRLAHQAWPPRREEKDEEAPVETEPEGNIFRRGTSWLTQRYRADLSDDLEYLLAGGRRRDLVRNAVAA